MTFVWEKSAQKGSALLLMIAIADFANDDGVAWPAVGTLADKIRMDERYTHRLLSALVEAGELRINERAGPKGCNQFVIVGVAPAPPGPRATLARKTPGGGARARKGVAPAPPEPSLNRQEPPEGGGAPPAPAGPKAKRMTSIVPAAVATYQNSAGLFPDKTLWQSMAEAIGEKPADLDFWGQVVAGWIARGWRKTNVAGMYEYFERRELPSTAKGYRGQPTDPMAPSRTPEL